jgi:hypothetical protein
VTGSKQNFLPDPEFEFMDPKPAPNPELDLNLRKIIYHIKN